MITDVHQLGHKLRSWVLRGGHSEDAALIANVLSAAKTLTDVLAFLQHVPRFTLVPKGNRTYGILDSNSQSEILTFSLVEHANGSEVHIL